ncbi:PiggyBac transposable element-derived protein 4 [Anthophora retusa]
MSRDRFTDILRYIRFDHSATREARKMDDKLAPIRHVTDTFVKNCKSCYNASDIGCVDEQPVTFRGRCSFKVYMPSKPGKYEIKIWTLCDSKTFYCCNMEVYLGKRGINPEKQQKQHVIKQMVDF